LMSFSPPTPLLLWQYVQNPDRNEIPFLSTFLLSHPAKKQQEVSLFPFPLPHVAELFKLDGPKSPPPFPLPSPQLISDLRKVKVKGLLFFPPFFLFSPAREARRPPPTYEFPFSPPPLSSSLFPPPNSPGAVFRTLKNRLTLFFFFSMRAYVGQAGQPAGRSFFSPPLFLFSSFFSSAFLCSLLPLNGCPQAPPSFHSPPCWDVQGGRVRSPFFFTSSPSPDFFRGDPVGTRDSYNPLSLPP